LWEVCHATSVAIGGNSPLETKRTRRLQEILKFAPVVGPKDRIFEIVICEQIVPPDPANEVA